MLFAKKITAIYPAAARAIAELAAESLRLAPIENKFLNEHGQAVADGMLRGGEINLGPVLTFHKELVLPGIERDELLCGTSGGNYRSRESGGFRTYVNDTSLAGQVTGDPVLDRAIPEPPAAAPSWRPLVSGQRTLAFRYRKSLRLAPGLRVNLSKRGALLSVGG